MCELGIPYSDPIADGPVIQASYTRALARHVKLAQIFEMVRGARGQADRADREHGQLCDRAAARARALRGRRPSGRDRRRDRAGPACRRVAGPGAICRAADFSLIQLVTPTTPRDRALRIAQSSSGFLYYVSVTGITGERTALPKELVDNVAWLRGQTDLPICIGFGISQPEHVRTLAEVADGLIVGSAIVRRMAEADNKPREQVVGEIGDYVAELAAALNG